MCEVYGRATSPSSQSLSAVSTQQTMVLPLFDRQILEDSLSQLRSLHQLAFGALCCERLLPSYEALQSEAGWGNVGSIKSAIDLAWSVCKGNKADPLKVKRLIRDCESVASSFGDFDSQYTTLAQNCAFAACSLLDYMMEGSVCTVAQIASYTTDSVDLFIQEYDNMDPNAPDLEQQILAHPLMQRELRNQLDDHEALRKIDKFTEETVSLLRKENEALDLSFA